MFSSNHRQNKKLSLSAHDYGSNWRLLSVSCQLVPSPCISAQRCWAGVGSSLNPVLQASSLWQPGLFCRKLTGKCCMSNLIIWLEGVEMSSREWQHRGIQSHTLQWLTGLNSSFKMILKMLIFCFLTSEFSLTSRLNLKCVCLCSQDKTDLININIRVKRKLFCLVLFLATKKYLIFDYLGENVQSISPKLSHDITAGSAFLTGASLPKTLEFSGPFDWCWLLFFMAKFSSDLGETYTKIFLWLLFCY